MFAPTPQSNPIIIIGAGMAGLSAALDLSADGHDVLVLEKSAVPGGKMREVQIGAGKINAGPTVFTMRWVFDDLLAKCGTTLEAVIPVTKSTVLARHGWQDGSKLDLFADIEQSAEAISEFSNVKNAEGYRRFCTDSKAIFQTLQHSYIAASRPNPLSLMARVGPLNIQAMLQMRPFSTLWGALGDYFDDPRLRQLFGRYATYCGSSPFAAPATLMLVAHVEQAGVYIAKGGMHGLAKALANQAEQQGAKFYYNTAVQSIVQRHGKVTGIITDDGTEIPAAAVIFNGDISALSKLSEAKSKPVPSQKRSLSAMTWAFEGHATGFDLAHHTVLFSDDYRAEFDEIFKKRQIPQSPTTYLCAPDRNDTGRLTLKQGEPERIFCLINAPANGDQKTYSDEEVQQCLTQTQKLMARCGLTLTMTENPVLAASPTTFNRLFPQSGGALYGQANHGPLASFQRQGSRTKILGLYLAGGSVHPGPGVPMAALSGRLAAAALAKDRGLTRTFRHKAMSGGMLMG